MGEDGEGRQALLIRELQALDRDVRAIRRFAHGTPEVAAMYSRRLAEAIATGVYLVHHGREPRGRTRMLDACVKELRRCRNSETLDLPGAIADGLETVQRHTNPLVHHHRELKAPDASLVADRAAVAPALRALPDLIRWYWRVFLDLPDKDCPAGLRDLGHEDLTEALRTSGQGDKSSAYDFELAPWYALSGKASVTKIAVVLGFLAPLAVWAGSSALIWHLLGGGWLPGGIAAGLLVGMLGGFWFFLAGSKDEVPDDQRPGLVLSSDRPAVNIRVDGRIGWMRTGVKLCAETDYLFQTSGGVVHSMFSGKHDAYGNPDPLSPRSKLTAAKPFNVGALVGRVGKDGDAFLVAEQPLRRFEDGGHLFLAINDWPRFDNSGDFGVRLTDVAALDLPDSPEDSA